MYVSGCPEQVDVLDVGLSDHHLLRWSVDATSQAPPSTVTYCRAWRRLDIDDFRTTLSSSRLCQPNDWPDDVHEMAAVYDVELTRLLDQLIPARQVVRRPRHSDPWFDSECRRAKRLGRRLERRYAAARRRAADDPEVNAAKTA